MKLSHNKLTTRITGIARKYKVLVRFLAILFLFIVPGGAIEFIASHNQGLRLMIGNSQPVYIFSKLLVDITTFFLALFGYHPVIEFSTTFYYYNVFLLSVNGGASVYIGMSCLGVGLIWTYIALITAFPGNIKSKAVFIPLGIIFIIILNILRISFLTIMLYYYPNPENISHTVTGFLIANHHKLFNYGVLVLIFVIFMIWVKFYSGYEGKKQRNACH
jgi:exosortase/archaeosortase family protein